LDQLEINNRTCKSPNPWIGLGPNQQSRLLWIEYVLHDH